VQRQIRTLKREILSLRAELVRSLCRRSPDVGRERRRLKTSLRSGPRRGERSTSRSPISRSSVRPRPPLSLPLTSADARAGEHKAAFGKLVTALHFVAITALPFAFTSYHSKSAVFYLPQGWFGPAEWFLGLPFAPAGAVSCAVWTMFAKRGVRVVGSAAWELVEGALLKPASAQPIAVPASSEKSTDGAPAPATSAAGKEKEL